MGLRREWQLKMARCGWIGAWPYEPFWPVLVIQQIASNDQAGPLGSR